VTLSLVPASAEEIKLKHFVCGGHGTAWRDYLTQMAEKFKALYGVTIEFEISGGGSVYADQLLTRIAGGVAPDVTDSSPSPTPTPPEKLIYWP